MESVEWEYYEMKLGEIIIYNKNFLNLWMGIRSRIDLDCKEKITWKTIYREDTDENTLLDLLYKDEGVS